MLQKHDIPDCFNHVWSNKTIQKNTQLWKKIGFVNTVPVYFLRNH